MDCQALLILKSKKRQFSHLKRLKSVNKEIRRQEDRRSSLSILQVAANNALRSGDMNLSGLYSLVQKNSEFSQEIRQLDTSINDEKSVAKSLEAVVKNELVLQKNISENRIVYEA